MTNTRLGVRESFALVALGVRPSPTGTWQDIARGEREGGKLSTREIREKAAIKWTDVIY